MPTTYTLGQRLLVNLFHNMKQGEMWTWVPRSSPLDSPINVTVRARRNEGHARHDGENETSELIFTIELKFLNFIDTRWGGVVAPHIGDIWTGPLSVGGTPVQWTSIHPEANGAPKGGDGIWTQEVTYIGDTPV